MQYVYVRRSVTVKMKFVNPYLLQRDLRKGGVHLTTRGKDLMCGAIATAALDFTRPIQITRM